MSSDEECLEALNDLEGDQACVEALEQVEAGFDFQLLPRADRRSRNLGVRHRVFEGRLVQRGGGENLNLPRPCLPQQLEEALRRAIDNNVLSEDNVRPDDALFIYIGSNRLRSSFNSCRTTVRDWQEGGAAAEEILQQLSRLLNSNEQFQLDDSFTLSIAHAQDPGVGRGRVRLGSQPIEQLLKKKKCVVKLTNTDELCCARALVTMKAHREHGSQSNIYRYMKQGRALQEHQARALHEAAGVVPGACGLEEIARFQSYLSDYQIVVLSADHAGHVIYKGPHRVEENKRLILVKVGEHYHGCTNLAAFFGQGGYCLTCEKSFAHNTLASHRCKGKKCFGCCQSACTDQQRERPADVHCDICHRQFFGPNCLQNHLQYQQIDGRKASKNNSVCATKRKCGQCHRLLQSEELKQGHVCGTSKCPCCHKWCALDSHRCYIQQVTGSSGRGQKRRIDDLDDEEEEEKETIMVDWDAETMQGDGVHVANLICAQSTHAPGTKFEWCGASCVCHFVDFLVSLADGDDKVIAVAHNGKGFDHYLVVDVLYQKQIKFQQIVCGGKILSITVSANLLFKDSLCFLPMPLASFPKAFGIEEEVKGFFPHHFNIPDNQDYVGALPAKDYYDPDGMSTSRREEFDRWYRQEKESGRPFDFQAALREYCHSDVALLKAGRETFCQEFREVAGFDPFDKCLTIASACNLFYRSSCMPADQIASEPSTGWHGRRKPYSDAALRWLKTLPNFFDIRHARNGGEAVIHCPDGSQIHPDGMDETRREVYQFYGCYFHGCPACFDHDRHAVQPRLGGKSLEERYQGTSRQEEELKRQGYNVVTKWQCHFKEQGPVDPIETPLEPRQAFFGGRTNVTKLYHRCEHPGEQIRYVDFTSLYPWVNKYGEYPVGHPEIIFEPPTTRVSCYFGLVRCTILPPHGLYHPVLPHRCGGKLTFPLCTRCVELQVGAPPTERRWQCNHTDAERCLTGTWCTPELEEAVTRGYVIKKIHEVWHFTERSTTLFKTYVNTFLKLKQEASGWPAWTLGGHNEAEKKQQYVDDYAAHEGVRLEAEKIRKNPGRRSMAKLMLNSFWGKYGQASNKSQVKVCRRPSELYPLLKDATKDVRMLRAVTDEMVEVVYKNVVDADPVQPNINIFVACFTTCWARLKLYREGIAALEPRQVIYFDTDSIIYSHKPGQPELPLGDHLGEYTSECDDGDFIVEFASAGPKNYGYVTSRGKIECKVRGFSLNVRGKAQLNFQVLKDNIIEEVTQPQEKAREIPVFNPHKIVRDVDTKQLRTQTEIKRYRMVTDKRVVDPSSYYTYPYGYEDEADTVTEREMERALVDG